MHGGDPPDELAPQWLRAKLAAAWERPLTSIFAGQGPFGCEPPVGFEPTTYALRETGSALKPGGTGFHVTLSGSIAVHRRRFAWLPFWLPLVVIRGRGVDVVVRVPWQLVWVVVMTGQPSTVEADMPPRHPQ